MTFPKQQIRLVQKINEEKKQLGFHQFHFKRFLQSTDFACNISCVKIGFSFVYGSLGFKQSENKCVILRDHFITRKSCFIALTLGRQKISLHVNILENIVFIRKIMAKWTITSNLFSGPTNLAYSTFIKLAPRAQTRIFFSGKKYQESPRTYYTKQFLPFPYTQPHFILNKPFLKQCAT